MVASSALVRSEPELSRLLSSEEVADLLGTTPRTIRRMAAAGELRRIVLGHRMTRYQQSDVVLLAPLTPHEARHTFASYLIASGVDPKQIQTYVGHTDIRTTFNVYGHLLPGSIDTARNALDALLERSG